MIKRWFSIVAFSFSIITVYGQTISLPKNQYILGEDILFDAILSEEDTSSYFWVHLLGIDSSVEPSTLSSVAFQTHLIDGRLHQGVFSLAYKDLPTGPYIMTAFTAAGFNLGLRSLFIVRANELELWQFLMNGRAKGEISSQSDFSLPELTTAKLCIDQEEIDIGDWDILASHTREYPDGYFLLEIETIDGNQHHLQLPPAHQLITDKRGIQAGNQKEIWIKNKTEVPQSYEVFWRNMSLSQFELLPADSLSLDLATFPTGNLHVQGPKEIYTHSNIPHPILDDIPTFQIKTNENLQLGLPALGNGLSDQGQHFVQVQISQKPLAYGISLDKRVEPSKDATAFIRTWVEAEEGVGKDFRGLIIMDSTNQFAVNTQPDGSFEISAEMAYQLQRGEGRVRLGQMDKGQAVKVSYPEMDYLWRQLEEEYQPYLGTLGWNYRAEEPLREQMNFASFELLDLEEIVINAKSDEELLDAMKLQPFALDWINTDFLCNQGVLNCPNPEHGIRNGNIVNTFGRDLLKMQHIPLHIYINYQAAEELRNAKSSIRQKVAAAGFDVQKINSALDKIRPNRVRLIHVDERSGRGNPPTFAYEWNAEDYLKNMSTVQLIRENAFQDFSDGNILLSESQSHWLPYKGDLNINLSSSFATGDYYVYITYWDLYHTLSTTVSYEVLVRN